MTTLTKQWTVPYKSLVHKFLIFLNVIHNIAKIRFYITPYEWWGQRLSSASYDLEFQFGTEQHGFRKLATEWLSVHQVIHIESHSSLTGHENKAYSLF